MDKALAFDKRLALVKATEYFSSWLVNSRSIQVPYTGYDIRHYLDKAS